MMTPEQEQELGRCIFREANDAFFVVDPGTLRFLEANPAAQRMTGMRRKEILNLSLRDLISSTTGIDIERLIHACQTTVNFTAEAGYDLALADGSNKAVHVSVSRMHCENGPWGLLVVRDISKLKQAEENRRQFEVKMMQSQKLESLGMLAGGIAHDFNNILTSILGFADLALLETSQNHSPRHHLEQVLIGARRAAELTNQMLAYSGRSKFSVQPLQLSELVDELGHLLAVSVSKKCVVQYEFAKPLPSVLADASQIRQIVMNLILNASEALEDRAGVITLRTKVCEFKKPRSFGPHHPDVIDPGIYACLEVQDTGVGMSKEIKDRIFDPFFTTKLSGRGLGLAAVLGIVRGHRGAIEIESELGHGTLFRVYFPSCELPAESSKIHVGDVNGWHGAGTVIVIDDESSICELAEAMLRRLGFHVRTARDGRQGLDLIRSVAEPIKVVFLDINMPHLDGIETLRELRKDYPKMPVVLLSGYTESSVNERIPAASIAGYVQKPFRLVDIMQAVRKAMGE